MNTNPIIPKLIWLAITARRQSETPAHTRTSSTTISMGYGFFDMVSQVILFIFCELGQLDIDAVTIVPMYMKIHFVVAEGLKGAPPVLWENMRQHYAVRVQHLDFHNVAGNQGRVASTCRPIICDHQFIKYM